VTPYECCTYESEVVKYASDQQMLQVVGGVPACDFFSTIS